MRFKGTRSLQLQNYLRKLEGKLTYFRQKFTFAEFFMNGDGRGRNQKPEILISTT